MFDISYCVKTVFTGEIENLTDEAVRFYFMMGNVTFQSEGIKIEMDWEWIPLVD